MIRADVAIVGAGQAADPILTAGRAAGRRVVVIERDRPGGSCVNWGCTPTKAVLLSANLLHRARKAHEFGLTLDVPAPSLDRILASAEELVAYSVDSITRSLGDSLVKGDVASVMRDAGQWRLTMRDGSAVEADSVILNVGSRTRMPDIPGLDDAITSENWLSVRDLPPRLAFLGAGPISLEMAQFYARLGSEVTVIDTSERLLPQEPREIGDALLGYLEAEGIRFAFGQTPTAYRDGTLKGLGLDVDRVFVAAGRASNLGRIDVPGLSLDDQGWAQVDERRRTGLEGLYVVGDARGGAQFTHTAWDDGRVVADDLFGNGERRPFPHPVYALFTDPELGRVGAMDGELLRFDVSKNAAAQASRDAYGSVWLAHDAGRVRGVAVLAARGSEMAQLVTPLLGRPISDLDSLLTIHPTWMEAVQASVGDA